MRHARQPSPTGHDVDRFSRRPQQRRRFIRRQQQWQFAKVIQHDDTYLEVWCRAAPAAAARATAGWRCCGLPRHEDRSGRDRLRASFELGVRCEDEIADVRTLFNERGNLRPISALTDDESAAITSIDVITRRGVAGNASVDTVVRIQLADKTKSLEMLAKHFALMTERLEMSSDGQLLERLDRGRLRGLGENGHMLPSHDAVETIAGD
ncbi:MAG TPA: hypothetical protein VKE96_00670 [Vicinamibacterales bacterium]|nr:hypothetical protein [Vicinamibacterales bacterium]